MTRTSALALALVALAAPSVAAAKPATSEEVRALARRAADEPAALEELRRIDVVDGRQVDLDAAIGDSEGDALRRRLAVLAEGGAPVQTGGSPREEASQILSDRRFHESEVPRPFHGFLEWVRDTFGFVARPFEWLADRLPGGSATMWTLLGLAAIAVAVVVSRRTAQRRGGRALEVARRRREHGALDPRELEREADEAERRGELDRAVRLRFRAGLLRLGRKEVIPLRESLTTGQVRRLIRLDEFDRLARDHDEITYGSRPARPEDTDSAREVWPVVVAKAGPR